MKKLAIVLPAFNEEKNIDLIIRRCLESRHQIINQTPLEDVEIIVVSDGSTDRTEKIARCHEPSVKVIAYEENRGYGAAIKTGFAATDADLLSFLDADGTCDPMNFVPMIKKLLDRGADICIGSRMGPGSKMPLVRRLGNLGYRFIINCLGDSHISDAASGMRVIARGSLAKLSPLPDGMDFTPAMSCRAVMDPDLKIEECPMSYEERVGRSKLSVVRDGLRFLKSILNISVSFRPLRFFGPAGIVFLLAGLFYGLPLAHKYLITGVVEESMIYRTFGIIGFTTCGLVLFGIGVLMERVVRFVHPQNRPRCASTSLMERMLSPKMCLAFSLPFLLATVLVMLRSFLQYLFTGSISQHWASIAAGMLLATISTLLFAFGMMGQAIDVLFWHHWNKK